MATTRVTSQKAILCAIASHPCLLLDRYGYLLTAKFEIWGQTPSPAAIPAFVINKLAPSSQHRRNLLRV